jgi:hypothetical protein
MVADDNGCELAVCQNRRAAAGISTSGSGLRSDFEGNPVEQFAGAHDARHAIEGIREIPLVAGNDVIGLGGLCSVQKFRVGRIGRDGR